MKFSHRFPNWSWSDNSLCFLTTQTFSHAIRKDQVQGGNLQPRLLDIVHNTLQTRLNVCSAKWAMFFSVWFGPSVEAPLILLYLSV